MSADVTLQVGVEARRGREEGQADGHQLPAALQAVVAEVLRGLPAQLDVQLVAEALVAPPTDHHLAGGSATKCLHHQVFTKKLQSCKYLSKSQGINAINSCQYGLPVDGSNTLGSVKNKK